MKKRNFFLCFFLVWWLAVPPGIGAAGEESPVSRNVGDEPRGFLAISAEMEQFLDSQIRANGQRERLKALVQVIFDKSLLGFRYSDHRTCTVGETFKQRTGNCLSYTAMFVVMARYLGLNASFQEVYDFSSWTKRGDMVIFNRHMNAVVMADGRPVEVDFDFSRDRTLRHTRLVSDQRALAHYYNNIGAEALIAREDSRGELLLKEAIRLDEAFSLPWTNLGLLYQYSGKWDQAEAAYKKAFRLDNRDYTALTNLSHLYRLQGKPERADKLEKRLQKYYRKNPFYHYSLGETAFNQSSYRLAIRHYKQAIKKKANEPEFYARLAASYFQLGQYKEAEKNLKKAGKLAKSSQKRNLYARKLNYLYLHSGAGNR